MADTKRFGALLIAAATCAGLGAAFAAGNAVNITGDMQIDAVDRKGTTTFASGQNFTNLPTDGAAANGFRNPYGTNKDESNFFQTRVYLNFGVDLAQNVRAFVQVGGKSIAGNNIANQGANTNMNTGTQTGGDSSFNARVRQAYVQLNEVMVPELGFRIGIQDVVKGMDRGDGNHFVMDSRGWGKHFQIRNGGTVERSFSTRGRNANLPVATANGFDDLNDTDGTPFEWAVTFSKKDMFSGELFYVKLEETGSGFTNDSYIWGIDGKLPLKMVNDKSVLTAHLFNVKDDSFVQSELTAATKPGSGSNFWQYGLGADMFFSAFEGYGEFAVQSGKFADNYGQTSLGQDQGQEKRQSAYAYYLGGKYMLPGMTGFKPALDVSYWSYSGDDNQHDESNSGFINYGDNKSTLVVEDGEYGIGLNNNYNVWRFKGSVDLDGLMMKNRSTLLTASWNSFDVNASKIRGGIAGAGAGLAPLSATYGVQDINPGHFGDEFDVTLAHDYSENVTFKLGYGIFLPGSYVRENANLNVYQVWSAGGATTPALGTPGLDQGDGSPAKVMVFTTSVKF